MIVHPFVSCGNHGAFSPVLYHSLVKNKDCILTILCYNVPAIQASVDKSTHGFSRGKTTADIVILVGGRQPACLVCLASRRLSSAKNSEGLAGRSGALSARQRTPAYRRMSRTITQQTAAQSGPQACVPLSTDAMQYISGGVPVMAHVINDSCVSCGACESACPVGAISMGSDHMVIDASICLDCGACAGACPMGAIAPEG